MSCYPTVPHLQTYSAVYLNMCTNTLVKVGSLHMFAIKNLGASKGNWLNKL